MKTFRYTAVLVTLALLLGAAPGADAQGKGKGQGDAQAEGKGKGQGGGRGEGKAKGRSGGETESRGKGQGNARSESKGRGPDDARGVNDRNMSRGNARSASRADVNRSDRGSARGRFARALNAGSMPPSVRGYATSGRARDAIAAAAIAHAFARGRNDNDLRITSADDGLRIVNLRGDPLVFLDEQRARDLGRWRVGVLDDRVNEGSPSFCRSGAGHPVWGRQWCLDKGFGLGGYEDFRWGRSLDPVNITYHQPSLRDQLMGAALEQVLGTNTYNRLALHAVTLGLVDPIAATWYTEPTGVQLMRVNSGVYPVAEIVDTNRDFTGDLLLLALRSFL
jgi:hypothetical protein